MAKETLEEWLADYETTTLMNGFSGLGKVVRGISPEAVYVTFLRLCHSLCEKDLLSGGVVYLGSACRRVLS